MFTWQRYTFLGELASIFNTFLGELLTYHHTFLGELAPKAPPPRRLRGFPLPLWRGVNSLANYSRMVASVPHPPASNVIYPLAPQHNPSSILKNINKLWGAGEQGTEALVLLWFAWQSLVGWWHVGPCSPTQGRKRCCVIKRWGFCFVLSSKSRNFGQKVFRL